MDAERAGLSKIISILPPMRPVRKIFDDLELHSRGNKVASGVQTGDGEKETEDPFGRDELQFKAKELEHDHMF